MQPRERRRNTTNTIELSSFRQTKLTPATDTNQRTVGTADLANAVLTTAVETWRRTWTPVDPAASYGPLSEPAADSPGPANPPEAKVGSSTLPLTTGSEQPKRPGGSLRPARTQSTYVPNTPDISSVSGGKPFREVAQVTGGRVLHREQVRDEQPDQRVAADLFGGDLLRLTQRGDRIGSLAALRMRAGHVDEHPAAPFGGQPRPPPGAGRLPVRRPLLLTE
jgi:hypothetical protein